METRRKMKLGASDKAILGTGYVLLGLFVLAVLIPLVYVVAASFIKQYWEQDMFFWDFLYWQLPLWIPMY